MIFRALPKHCLPLFWLSFLRRRQIFKKTVEKAVFRNFLKNFDKKNRGFFLARAPPSKLVYIGAFRKILGSVGQKWISQKLSKGRRDPLGRQGVESLKRRSVQYTPPPPPPPPKSAPALFHSDSKIHLRQNFTMSFHILRFEGSSFEIQYSGINTRESRTGSDSVTSGH